jgi:hypothetical protein
VPRRNLPPRGRRARRAAAAGEPEPLRAPDIAGFAPEGWHLRVIQPAAAVKEYRCPGCNQEIRVGTRHVVAWRDGAPDDRRHWHAPCWRRTHPAR